MTGKMQVMILTAALAGFALGAALPPGDSAGERRCLPPATVIAIVALQHPGTVAGRIGGGQAERFIAAYNAKPPVTAYEADTILIFVSPRLPAALAVFFKAGCMSGGDWNLPFGELERLLDLPPPPGLPAQGPAPRLSRLASGSPQALDSARFGSNS